MLRATTRLLLPMILCCLFASAQSPSIETIAHPDSCRRIVQILAADSFLGRYSGTPENDKAAHFIAEEFRKAGCQPGGNDGSFFVPFKIPTESDPLQSNNVMGILPGKSKPHEWVIFSAHYDHIGILGNGYFYQRSEATRPKKGDTIHNGANDNASGVTALIMLARYFAAANNNERTIVFAAFSGEELGLIGSRHMAQQMSNFDSVVAMINMDMIGVPISRRNQNPYITGSQYSNLQNILNKTLAEKAPEKFGSDYFRRDMFSSESLFTRSDNYWFAKLGIPAHTIIATHPRNKYYHSPSDEPHTLNYQLMSKIISALAIGTSTIIDGTETPTRINPLRIRQD